MVDLPWKVVSDRSRDRFYLLYIDVRSCLRSLGETEFFEGALHAKKCFEVRDVGIFLGLFIPEECGRKKKSVELFASVVVDVIKLINQVLGVHHASKIIQ